MPMNTTLRNICSRIVALATLALTLTSAHAADSWIESVAKRKAPMPEPSHVSMKLISASNAIVPQANNQLAIVLENEPGWHTYWRMPGESGLPTRFSFKAPSELSISAPEFPIPEKIEAQNLISYGYEGTTTFPFTVKSPRFVTIGQKVTISAQADFLVCKDICIPGKAQASITLPYRITSEPTPEAPAIDAAKKLIPEHNSIANLQAQFGNGLLNLSLPEQSAQVKTSLVFFPLSNKLIDLKAPEQFVRQKDGVKILQMRLNERFSAEKTPELQGVLVADGGPDKGGWALEIEAPLTQADVTPVTTESPSTSNPAESTPAESTTPMSFFTALIFALVGGLILNLMPCVFPVLSLKLLDLIEGHRQGKPIVSHGVAFTVGVLICMLIISGVLLALRSFGVALGWGFQLQNPIVVSALLLLFVTLGVNLLGLFEFTAGSGLADAASSSQDRRGPVGSFFTGILAVIVASPCTAPFMGAALGYALTVSPVEALSVFLALGLGMALPWLLLCIFPGWARFLPRPGQWMVTLRRWMALPMILAAIWLGWVLSKQINMNGMLIVIASIGATLIFWWLLGREQWGKGRNRPLMTFMGIVIVFALALVGMDNFSRNASSGHKGEWTPWSPTAVENALKAGKPAFVDFTAAWCITCQANKFTTLNRDRVQEAFAKHHVELFMADWTNQDPAITEALARFGRSGVPLYLLYWPDGRIDVLPQLLTPDGVIKALDALPS